MLRESLINKRSTIINGWVQSIVETYPSETSKFLRLQKDRFSNPVGYVISNSAEKLFDEIIGSNNTEKIRTSLNDIIKIRAVQDFLPSQAAGFVFSLKRVIRDELEQEITSGKIFEELMDIESRIDEMALRAFDVYMEAREKIFQIRVNEIKKNQVMNF